jgi:hypothetical protein
MRHLGSFRMYESVIRELAVRGHDIHLALDRGAWLALGSRPALETLVAEHPRVTWSRLSPSTSPLWFDLAGTIRLWVDYLRYFLPEYDATPKLKARAEVRVPPTLVRISNWRLFQQAANRHRLLAVLRALERALPPVPQIERQLEEEQPDVVLVTPLVYLGSSQFDTLRTAMSMGLRTAFCVGSWDHLSSKALIRDLPDRVLVWNETQKDEAVHLQGVPPDRVVVTGAQCYDHWFGRQPVRSRDDFCRRVGLPTDRRFLLYVCSALFPGSPVEAEFVRRWVQSLRESPHEELRSLAVLIRPHPARMAEWNSVDLASLEHVVLYGSNPVDDTSKDDYFESLFYSSAVVGMNTSAFLEAAVVDRPVHTILLPEFHENQEGTLHFQYLLTVGGGVLLAGRSFEAHHAQLLESLRRSPDQPGTNRQFVRDFIRPHGLDTRATPIFCDAVDDLLRMPAPAPERTPLRFQLLRVAMVPTFLLLRWMYGSEVVSDDRHIREQERRRQRQEHGRKREERLRSAEAKTREQARVRADTLAAREATVQANRVERQRAEAAKAAKKRERTRAKSARVREKGRLVLRARLKRGASRWLSRWRPGQEGQSP